MPYKGQVTEQTTIKLSILRFERNYFKKISDGLLFVSIDLMYSTTKTLPGLPAVAVVSQQPRIIAHHYLVTSWIL